MNHTNDIYIYVSNLQNDIDKHEVGTLDRSKNVFVHFMDAWIRMLELVKKHSTKSDGSVLSFHILFYKGEHFMLDVDNYDGSIVTDESLSDYEIKVRI